MLITTTSRTISHTVHERLETQSYCPVCCFTTRSLFNSATLSVTSFKLDPTSSFIAYKKKGLCKCVRKIQILKQPPRGFFKISVLFFQEQPFLQFSSRVYLFADRRTILNILKTFRRWSFVIV